MARHRPRTRAVATSTLESAKRGALWSPSMTESLRRSPLYARHQALGARFVPFAGWEMPVQYQNGVTREHAAVRTAVGLFDVSHMGELFLDGPGASAAL